MGHKETAELLMAKGATISLHMVVSSGDLDMLRRLIAEGADVNAKDRYGRTSLHLAVMGGHKNIVEYLLSRGASIDPRDNVDRTPLHYVAGAGDLYEVEGIYVDIAKLLLDEGANINAADKLGWTPLHFATNMRNTALVKLFTNRGANLSAVNKRGRTAFSLAREMVSLYKDTGHILASEVAKVYNEIADCLSKDGRVYYVANHGKDLYPGTLQRPFRTLAVAIEIAEPGETIFVRGGTYNCLDTINIDKSGEQGRPIHLRAYPGESPIFDFSTSKGEGILIKGAFWYIKGLTVTETEHGGLILDTEGAHHNILEQVVSYANHLKGMHLARGAAHNLFLNCDSYRNFDLERNGEHADGFCVYCDIGRGNIFIGCRAWNNSDDGFDTFYTGESVRFENCYAYRNGENMWSHPCFSGDRNGFKLHGGPHVLIRCVAWDHSVGGFVLNAPGNTLYNCTAFRNRTNYPFNWPTSTTEKNVLRNCLSFKGRVHFKPKVDDKHNSWNESVGTKIAEDDFLSLDDSVIIGPRNSDGSIPANNFLRLAQDSDAIDRGVDVGLSFNGKSPDLGAFEYRPAATGESNIKGLHQAVRDHDIQKIRSLLSEGTDVNEKDWLGYAALHWAIYFGYTDVTEVLISEGANPNIQSDTGRTPLEIVTEMGYEGMVELLRKHGAKE